VSHVLDRDPGHLLEVLVPDVDEDTVDALVLAVDVQLGEHDDVLRVASAVGDLKQIAISLQRSLIQPEVAALLPGATKT